MNEPPKEKLIAVLAYSDLSREAVCNYLKFINAPENLHCLVRISRNFVRIVPIIREIMSIEVENYGLTLDELSAFEKVARVIATVPPGIELINGVDRQTTNAKHAPLWNFYKTNSYYVSLWYPAVENPYEKQFQQLMAHLTLSLCMFKGLELANKTYEVMLKARQITEIENSETLQCYPLRIMTLKDYSQELSSLDDKFGHTFLILFRYVLERRIPLTRAASTKQPKAVSQLLQRNNSLPVISELSVEVDDLSIHVLRMPLLREEDDEIETIGEQSFSSTEFITSSFSGKNPTQGRTAHQHFWRMRNAATYIAMQNQYLTGRWDTLCDLEVSILIKEILTLGETDDPINLQMAYFLIAMFWTGCRLSDVKRYNTRANEGSGHFGCFFSKNYDFGWNIKSVHPLVDRIIPQIVSSQTPDAAKGFFLPCPLSFQSIISKYSMTPPQASEDNYEEFIAEYENRLKQVVSKLNDTHGSRLTLNRISDYLFNLIVAQSDVTIAMLLTGRDHWLGRNPLHYTAVPVSYLQQRYRIACTSILKVAGLNVNVNWPEHKNKSKISRQIIGSRFRPDEITIKNLINHLKHEVTKAEKQSWSFHNLIGYHNALTLYTVFMIGFFTGFRAVCDPFFSESEIDWESGFAVISDKDSKDRYNARIVWLPTVCLEQIKFYCRHLDYLYNHLMLLNPDLYRRIRYQHSGGHHEKVPLLLLFDRNRDELQYRPAVVSQMVNNVYKLPLNANRHYLRSKMLEVNFPADGINAFMGHWGRGQEPWGKFSGMSPTSYRHALKMLFEMHIFYGRTWKALEEHPWA